MICTVSYRGVFRQEQYETVTIEGSITVDTDADLPDRDISGPDELAIYMTEYVERLVRPLIGQAAQTSRYDESATTLYDWKGFTDGTGDKAPQRQQGRRVRRRD